jgi:cysteine desulfurase
MADPTDVPPTTPGPGGERRQIYLDYAATTPLDPAVREAMLDCLDRHWANPSSAHPAGRRARAVVEASREQVAACLGAAADEIVFTGGATEAINTAILGVARSSAERGRHLVTSRIEHPATLGACTALERDGFDVTRVAPDAQGLIPPDAVRDAVRDDTVLVSLTHVNSEIGTVLDLPAIAGLCADRGVPLHIDAAQSAGKLPIDLSSLPVSLLSLSAHKIYGPKGAGALFVSRRGRRVTMTPLVRGGGQERGRRAGTLATHQIAGLAEALRLACIDIDAEQERLAGLRDRLWAQLQRLGSVWLNGHPTRRVAGHLNVSIGGVEGESLLLALEDLACSRGSACSSLHAEPSYVLRALGRDELLAGASLRLSLGRPTSGDDVDHAAARIGREVERLRALAPSP